MAFDGENFSGARVSRGVMWWRILVVALVVGCRQAPTRAPASPTVDDVLAGLETKEWTPRPEQEPMEAPEPVPALPGQELEPMVEAPHPTYLNTDSARAKVDHDLSLPCQQAEGCAQPTARAEPEMRVLATVSDPKLDYLPKQVMGDPGIERCLVDMLRDRCRREGAALVYRVSTTKTTRIGSEGVDAAMGACIDRNVRWLRRQPGPAVDLHIMVSLQRPADPSCPQTGR